MSDPNEQGVVDGQELVSDEDLFEQELERRLSGDEGQTEEPAAATQEPADPVDPVDPAPQGPEEPEWFRSMPEEARAAYVKAQQELGAIRQQYNALHGRLAPTQQENERLRQRLAETAQQPAPANPVGQPAGQYPAQPSSLISDAEFAVFRESFPDEAKALERVFGRQAQTIGELQSQLQQMRSGLYEVQQFAGSRERQSELERLTQAHPDWQVVRPSPEFEGWAQNQPAAVRQLVGSSRAEDCIWVLDRFKADLYLYQQSQQPQQSPSSGGNPAQQTRQRRQQIRSVPTPNSQQIGVGPPNSAPGQFQNDEEIWEQEIERRLRLQREAYR